MSLSVGGSKLETSFPLVLEPPGLCDFLGERSSDWEAEGDSRSSPFLPAFCEVTLVLFFPFGGMAWGDLTLLGWAGIGSWATGPLQVGGGKGREGLQWRGTAGRLRPEELRDPQGDQVITA